MAFCSAGLVPHDAPHWPGSSDDNVDLTWPIIETNLQCFLDGRFSEMLNLVPH